MKTTETDEQAFLVGKVKAPGDKTGKPESIPEKKAHETEILKNLREIAKER